MFRDKSGRVLTMADIKNASGTFNWEIRTGTPVPEEARRLHGLGRGAGQGGEYKAAIRYFDRAAKVSPDWPYPLYDAAYTCLLSGDFPKAYELYKRVNDLTPLGFFLQRRRCIRFGGK